VIAADYVNDQRQRIVYLPSKSDTDMSTGQDNPLVGALPDHLTPTNRRLARPLPEREAMLSGSAEPECCERLSLLSPGLGSAVSRPDEIANDAPRAMATKPVAHATIHQSVYGTATAASRACSTAVN
jgi:hypothetical protein